MPILSYPEGSNITVMNTSYHYPRKNEDGTWNKDFIDIVYKDADTGKKGCKTIYHPSYVFYKANDDVVVPYNYLYIDKDKVHPVECEYRNLLKTIAEETDNLEFFYENAKAGNKRANRALHTNPRVFLSDVHIEDHYRFRFGNEYANRICPITKSYFDIEVDTTFSDTGDIPELGSCPINAVSYLDDKTHTINTFLLRDTIGNNPLIAEFEEIFKDKNKSAELFKELQKFIIDNVGGKEYAEKCGLTGLGFSISFYDDEISLLKDLFGVINNISPDFMMAWNMAFDIPYIIERCYVLGIDPAEILSASDRQEKYAHYFIDEMHRNEYELRGDYYDIASNTIFIDQLIQFASRRKGQAAFPNFKLDTAADIITKGKVRKLNYEHITKRLADLPYKDFKTFVFYNIMDVVAQKCIEEECKDIDYIFGTAVSNNTRYAKCHRQTVYLVNRAKKYFYDQGFIMGNNINVGDSTTYPGAIVGDPLHNSDYAKLKIGDQIFDIVDNADDFDYKSLYPSEAREHNMAPDTQIGKIFISHKVHSLENPYNDPQYDRGGQFMEDLVTENTLEFAARWLGYGRIKEVLDDIDEYFDTHIPIFENLYTDDGLVKPFIVRPNCNGMIKPFYCLEENETIQPFVIPNSVPKNLISGFIKKGVR